MNLARLSVGMMTETRGRSEDGAAAGAPVIRSLIFHMPRHLSAQSPSPSSQCSLINRIGRGKKNGGRGKFNTLHCPVGISTFLPRLVNVVVTRYVAPESNMFRRVDRMSCSEGCTRR